MSEADFQMVMREIERLRLECNTPQKATEQLQREGLLDETGQTAAMYREPIENTNWQ